MEIKGFYFITDSTIAKKSVVDDVKAAVKAGVKIVQYREKNKSPRDMVVEALKIKEICKKRAIFLINDRIDIAMAIEADGVHLGQDDIPCIYARKLLGRDKIVGITVHNVEEAIKAEKDGANYVGVSPIFSTRTKKDAREPLGTKVLKEIKSRIGIPVVAVGGIDLTNLISVLEAGVDGISAVSAVITKDDVEEECRKFIKAIADFKNTSQ
ncbi:MAG TPA: thiamine phosphate synthase [bacterium]|nr:thiamine phosphate synthase [bacterium]HPP29932.1 thiamine phosphate synthase [bacterium]